MSYRIDEDEIDKFVFDSISGNIHQWTDPTDHALIEKIIRAEAGIRREPTMRELLRRQTKFDIRRPAEIINNMDTFSDKDSLYIFECRCTHKDTFYKIINKMTTEQLDNVFEGIKSHIKLLPVNEIYNEFRLYQFSKKCTFASYIMMAHGNYNKALHRVSNRTLYLMPEFAYPKNSKNISELLEACNILVDSYDYSFEAHGQFIFSVAIRYLNDALIDKLYNKGPIEIVNTWSSGLPHHRNLHYLRSVKVTKCLYRRNHQMIGEINHRTINSNDYYESLMWIASQGSEGENILRSIDINLLLQSGNHCSKIIAALFSLYPNEDMIPLLFARVADNDILLYFAEILLNTKWEHTIIPPYVFNSIRKGIKKSYVGMTNFSDITVTSLH